MMRAHALLLVLAGSAVGPRLSAADTQSHLSDNQSTKSSTIVSQIATALSMSQVSMKVIEQSPLDDQSDHRTISSFNVDGTKLTDISLSDQIVDMIAKQLEEAGVTVDDLADFIANQTRQREFGEDQYPDDAEDTTTEDPDTRADSDRDDPAEAEDEIDKSATDGSQGSTSVQRLLRASSPPAEGPTGPPQPGGGPDVFNNGTDYFAWLDEVIKRVRDRMAKNGNTADETALDERPGQMDGKQTHQGASRTGEKTDESHQDTSSGAQGFVDWKTSEDAHGGFDNIPKAVPMIVMSGNTYIKDIGNFRNSYQYSSLPMKIRTIEPNGNDSGLDLDISADNNSQNKPKVAKLESRTRDGNTRARDRLLRLTAQDSKVHGHDDGNTYHSDVHGHDDGDSRGDNSRDQGGDDSSTYHSDVHGHDDGDSRDNSRSQGGDDSSTYHSDVHGHDDGDSRGDNSRQGGDDSPTSRNEHDNSNTYHSDVHGHDDGDSTGDISRPILKAGWSNFHGHDDGSTNNSPVHGHDDGSTNNSPVHGHDDGSTNNSPVHGHDDGSTNNSPVHGHDESSSRNSPVHGHDDGSTNNSPVHGHDDGSTNNSPVHGHDDSSSNNSPVHGHDDGSTNNSPVHGHDDGSTNNSPVHGHDDGSTNNSPVHGHDDGSTNNSPVHGHDDGGPMRAAAPQHVKGGHSTSMTMTNVSLTVLGTALVVLAVAAVVTAKKMRFGKFRRQDYIEV